MSEKLVISESERRLRVLEIGSGVFPANKGGGKIFESSNVSYVGLDLPKEVNSSSDKSVLVGANAAHMPFKDNTFDHILMRSIFGQFTSRRPVSNISDIRLWGMYEAFRVLRPGGSIVISEENTPWDASQVEYYLKNGGFRVTDFAELKQKYEDTPEDNKYRQIRSKYYNNTPAMEGLTYWGYPYVMVAEKPLEPEYEEVIAEVRRVPGSVHEIQTMWADIDFFGKKSSELITRVIYKKGVENSDPSLVSTA